MQLHDAAQMNVTKILIACQQLERTCGALYHQFAEKCVSDEESRALFLDLARDEEDHAGRFELLFKIMEYTRVSCTIEFYYISNALRAMEGALAQVTASRQMPLKEMLRIAVKSEERLLGVHTELVADIADPSWKNYFHDLNHADLHHLEKIKNYQKLRG